MVGKISPLLVCTKSAKRIWCSCHDVVSGTSKVGTVVDLARVEHQALARYTNDAGNHVSVELRSAAALVLN